MLTKEDIRKDYLAKRLSLTDEETAGMNSALLSQCRQLPLQDVNIVHLFLPIATKREIDTYPLAAWLREQYPGIRLALSRSYLATGSMQHYLWDDETRLVPNSLGIPEPESGRLVAPEEIDLVFVPMLAFDERGHRVGYGKGMYDAFLRQCRHNVRKTGLCLFPPVKAIEDVYAGDVQLDVVVTPSKIWRFLPPGNYC